MMNDLLSDRSVEVTDNLDGIKKFLIWLEHILNSEDSNIKLEVCFVRGEVAFDLLDERDCAKYVIQKTIELFKPVLSQRNIEIDIGAI